MNWAETRERLIELGIPGDQLPEAWQKTNLHWANLRWANLREANLSGANLNEADLSGANLNEADLSGANLRGANLKGADLGGANLKGANLHWANLREANLSGANLSGANLNEADLSGANLRGANLNEANLNEADLSGANLSGANLRGAKWDHTTICLAPAPEGELIAWGKKAGRIVELCIPREARRSWATTRKLRCEWATVVDIVGDDKSPIRNCNQWRTTIYAIGEIVRPDSWDDDRWNECSHGIHCFLSQHEAEEWGR